MEEEEEKEEEKGEEGTKLWRRRELNPEGGEAGVRKPKLWRWWLRRRRTRRSKEIIIVGVKVK